MRVHCGKVPSSVHAFTSLQRRKTMFPLFVQVKPAGRNGFAQVTYHEVTFGPCLCGHHLGIDTIGPSITRRVREEQAHILDQRERLFLVLHPGARTRLSAALLMRYMRMRALYEKILSTTIALTEVEVVKVYVVI